MKNKIKKNIIALFMAIATIITSLGSEVALVQAAEKAELLVTESGKVMMGDGMASITISANSGQSLVGKDFQLYQLFYAENSQDGKSINYTFHESCKTALQSVVGEKLKKTPLEVTEYEVIDYIQSLNNNKSDYANEKQSEEGYYSKFRYFIEELRDMLGNLDSGSGTVFRVSDVKADGSVQINGLNYGYYIIDEISDNSDAYSASSLCMVSTANPEAAIKIKSDYPWVEKKILEDDSKDTIGNDGWNDMADYEVGQNIPYKFTSNVPNMNGYDSYYFAWHDVMDEALTFDPDSLDITIYEGDKEYALSKTDYKLMENVDGETFIVEISDLKAIVDTHFNHMDELGHNTYGQKIELNYQAVLNEKATEDAGRPGFENGVRLEFSNDPDSDSKGKTGYTPWDTVVCFTYKLNGLKVNNYNQELEGAKFRLYRDEKCEDEFTTNEIVSDKNGVFTISGLDSGIYYLKETDAPDGYRVIKDPIKLEITSEFSEDRNSYIKSNADEALVDLQFSANIKVFLDGIFDETETELETDIETGAGNLTVINTVGTKLPMTGSSATILLIVFGCVVIMLSRVLYKEKRKELL